MRAKKTQIGYHRPHDMAELVALAILEQPGAQSWEIMEHLRKTFAEAGKQFDSSRTTVYRWIEVAIERGLVERRGTTSAARYFATEQQCILWVQSQAKVPAAQRPRCSYNEDFLDAYVPNATPYLSQRNLDRLARRCPIGSAPLSSIGERDVRIFLSDLSFWSSHLEGNEYDYASTIQLLEHRTRKPGVSEADRVMILNHYDAVRYIIDHTVPVGTIARGAPAISVRAHDIMGLHAILSQDLLKQHEYCGAIRQSHVELRETAYIPPDIPEEISRLFVKILSKAEQIENPWEQALFLNVHLPYLQPFEDCNKRTARVACNIPLLRHQVTPMSWTDVPHRQYIDGIVGVYEHNEPALLAEVFTEGYLRSSERFSLMQRQGRPDQIACDYRFEIRKAVRELVLEDREFVPANISPEHMTSFVEYIARQIEAMKESPSNAVRFGIAPHELEQFLQRERQGASGTERERQAG